ncbi:hypothetical protein C8R43DRAFT_1013042 [Mycena crocata]|nr:hypothetical protein C8R43DRAFT_1013042 [Mycena crocata]
MAAEIIAILGESHSFDTIKTVVNESLLASQSRHGAAWIEEYLGRPPANAWPPQPLKLEDRYFDTAVVIGYDERREHVVLKRVDDFDPDRNCWDTLIVDSEGAEENRISTKTYCGLQPGDAFFCWERPYRYFEAWAKSSRWFLTSAESEFALDLFKLVDANRHVPSDDDDEEDLSGLLRSISYGGIEKAYNGSFQWTFAGARKGSTNTAVAIAAGGRGEDIWPALALDFGAWMAVRPDIWPSVPPTSLSSIFTIDFNAEPTTPSLFLRIPSEILIQILSLVSLPDLSSLLQTSRGIWELLHPLVDETLWHRVHYGDLRWILPVQGVKGEVDRANSAVAGWYANPEGLSSVFSSRGFPFASFISECVRSNSMRNRRRLWKIFKQYEALHAGSHHTLSRP